MCIVYYKQTASHCIVVFPFVLFLALFTEKSLKLYGTFAKENCYDRMRRVRVFTSLHRRAPEIGFNFTEQSGKKNNRMQQKQIKKTDLSNVNCINGNL